MTHYGGSGVDQIFYAGAAERTRIQSDGIVVITSGATPIEPTIKHSGTTGYLAKLRITNRSGQAPDKGGLLELGGVSDDGVSRSDIFGAVAGLKSTSGGSNREGYLQFSTSTGSALQEAMRIDSSGHAIIPAGVTLGTSAGTYTAANTLNDYEEGTFTVTINGASSVGNTTGYYTKIGNVVYWSYYTSAFTTTAVQASFTGLPFTSLNVSTGYQIFSTAHQTAAPSSTGGYIGVNGNTAYFTNDGTVTTPSYTAGTSKYIMASGHYLTN
jgi:hypothetical protein